jgi:hypothetical protein
MSYFVFFPWLKIRETISISDNNYELVRYALENLDDPRIDKILTCYKDFEGNNKSEFVLLRVQGKILLDDAEKDKIQSLWRFHHYLAFAALAEVEFFEPCRSNYTNYSAFKMIIQNVQGTSENICLSAKKKDGQSLELKRITDARFIQPYHVQNTLPKINTVLLTALLKEETSGNTDLWLPISTFNNTWRDEEEFDFISELVNVCAAMQGILKIGDRNNDPANENGFANGLSKLFESHIQKITKPENWGRSVPDRGNRATDPNLLSLWARDIYNTRSKLSHGSIPPKDSIWDITEHLLLAAFIFPLMVKTVLTQQSLYKLTTYPSLDKDNTNLSNFDTNCDELRLRAIGTLLVQSEPLHAQERKQYNDSIWQTALKMADDLFWSERIDKIS